MKKILLTVALIAGFLNPISANATSTFGCPTGSHVSPTDSTKCLMDVSRIAKNSNAQQVLNCPAGSTLNNSRTYCISAGTYYTGTPLTTYYCSSNSDTLNADNTCTHTISGTTYNATYAVDYYYCPTGGSLNGTTCVNSGSSYPATISYWCSYGTLSGSSCIGAPVIYTYPSANACRQDGGAWQGGGQCKFADGSTTSANQSVSCSSGGYYNNAGSCITSGNNYTASTAYTYVCNSGDIKNGSTCTTPATITIYNASSLVSSPCQAGDVQIVGVSINNCQVIGSTVVLPTITYTGICANNYEMESTSGDCVAIPFNQVELFADQVIYNCTTTMNGLVIETGIYTYDDTFSLPTLKRTCTQSTNQLGITSGLNGFYFCQMTLSSGTIYSFQSVNDLTGSSTTTWTYCFYTGDLEAQRDADSGTGDEVQFEGMCNYATTYDQYLGCWRALQA